MRRYIVRVAFDASTFAKVPPTSKRFEEGEELVFLERPERLVGYTLFALLSAGNRNDPYMTTDEIFQTNTEEL